MMDNKRRQAYDNLVRQLLNCPGGHEEGILQANQHLIDEDFLLFLGEKITFLTQIGQPETASFLKKLATRLFPSPGPPDAVPADDTQLRFLSKALDLTADSAGDPAVVFPLLDEHVHLLNNAFPDHLWSSTNGFFVSVPPGVAAEFAEIIGAFSSLVGQFPRGDKAVNMEIAITGLEAIERVLTRRAYPQKWAMTQNNLGNAFSNRIRGNRAGNVERAIEAYENALMVWTRETVPQDWALAQLNLGVAFRNRLRGRPAENLEDAIEAFENALTVFDYAVSPTLWAMTHQNLGNAFSNRIRGIPADNLRRALEAYEQALSVPSHILPLRERATIQHNYAIALCRYTEGDRAANIERALEAFEEALTVRTREALPRDWAATHHNLGNAFLIRLLGNRADNIDRALHAYQNAFEVYILRGSPSEHFMSAANLGNAAYEVGRWPQALEGYEAAIEVFEQIYTTANDRQAIRDLGRQAAVVYGRMVQTCLHLGQPGQALAYVERSKARPLADLLADRDHHPSGEIPPSVLEELDRLRRLVPALQHRIQQHDVEKGRLQHALTMVQKQLAQVLQQIRTADPTFDLFPPFKPISAQDIRHLLPDDRTALIEWAVADDRLVAFIITPHSPDPDVWQSSPEDLDALKNMANIYFSMYTGDLGYHGSHAIWEGRDVPRGHEEWRVQLSTFLAGFNFVLHLEERLERLPDPCDQLILVPHRYLHLIPLHALPLSAEPVPDPALQIPPTLGGKRKYECLLDRFKRGVYYAPSCQILRLIQTRSRPDFDTLLAIENPTQDLEYTPLEVSAIGSIFKPPSDSQEEASNSKQVSVLQGEEASKATLLAHAALSTAHCLHFACHGRFVSDLRFFIFVDNTSRDGDERDISRPLDSALLLAHDEPLTLDEIFGLSLPHCRLVTLSACETGLVDPRSTMDEYVGLPSGFLFAGSPCVVSSFWRVNDLSTSLLMAKFYFNLRLAEGGKSSVAQALNRAQLWVRDATLADLKKFVNRLTFSGEQGEEIKKWLDKIAQNGDVTPLHSPYYWAGFAAIGH